MLSKQVKQRIAKNKKRRIQCRTKNGRDLYRLIRSVTARTMNQAVKVLLQQADDLALTKQNLGISSFLDLPKGGFKRGTLPIITARRYPSEHKVDPLSLYRSLGGKGVVNVSLENDYKLDDIIMGLDPGTKETGFVTMKIGKPRPVNVGSLFDVNLDFTNLSIPNEEHMLKGGDVVEILTQQEAMRHVIQGVKDGSVPSIKIDSYSDFGVRGHLDADGKFTPDSFNLIDNQEKSNGAEKSS